jgi:SAM-dependent methyltransferase
VERQRHLRIFPFITAAVLLAAVGHRRIYEAVAAGKQSGITTGKTIHWARFYDPVVALLTLGRGRALREVTVDLAHINLGDTVLDVGCGTGAVTMPAKLRSRPQGQVIGIDPAPEMIAEARRKADRAGLAIDYRVAATEALPFPDATFDVVLSSLMMHHLPEDLKPRALDEIRRVLKPNGHLLVVDFKQPANIRGPLAFPMFFLHGMPTGVEDLPTLMTDAGFGAVETGPTSYGPVGFVRASAGR